MHGINQDTDRMYWEKKTEQKQKKTELSSIDRKYSEHQTVSGIIWTSYME